MQKPFLDPLISASDSNEYFNAISHLIGTILSISALAVLVTLAAIDHKPAQVIGFAIYGTSLFLSFFFSCLLHFFLLFGKYLRVFGILDHNAIYILIAGTYTPFCLTIFSGATGWILFGVHFLYQNFRPVVEYQFPADGLDRHFPDRSHLQTTWDGSHLPADRGRTLLHPRCVDLCEREAESVPAIFRQP
jgi:hypothetical protein